jgi:hypothetical protein
MYTPRNIFQRYLPIHNAWLYIFGVHMACFAWRRSPCQTCGGFSTWFPGYQVHTYIVTATIEDCLWLGFFFFFLSTYALFCLLEYYQILVICYLFKKTEGVAYTTFVWNYNIGCQASKVAVNYLLTTEHCGQSLTTTRITLVHVARTQKRSNWHGYIKELSS